MTGADSSPDPSRGKYVEGNTGTALPEHEDEPVPCEDDSNSPTVDDKNSKTQASYPAQLDPSHTERTQSRS
jgi:hypothetical protein